MARRGVGYSSLQRHIDSANSYSTLSTSLAEQQTAALTAQLSTFQASLSAFSTHHRAKILSSPSFRSHFVQLCAELGVDPLGGGAKGIWDKMGVGDWYYTLGVQIVDVCLHARERSGGLVALEEVIRAVTVLRRGNTTGKVLGGGATSSTSAVSRLSSSLGPSTSTTEISANDVQRAIAALEPLGCGYSLIEVGGRKVVRCYPGGLDQDSLVVVEAAGEPGVGRGAVSIDEVYVYTRKTRSGWTVERVERALEKALMDDAMVWIDEQAGQSGDGKEYYVPALFDFADGL